MLYLTNTLSGKKELFTPLKKGLVSLYVCGITPYAPAHLGHGRCYVSFDMLYRLLSLLGYKVTYCRNFTDIDDKLLKKAQELYNDQSQYTRVAQDNIDQYQQDMKQLNCLSPAVEPKVTEHIPEIIAFIEQLVQKGSAYQADGDVYFNLATFPTYGKLSKQEVTQLRAGARIEVRSHKKDPLDFVLWKSEPEGTFWNSPWGWGRPGWHIECSALAQKYLGDTIDIHAGGLDLIFPHHENEIAQSESLHDHVFARYWLHNGLMTINNEKMSKSLGNVFILHELFEQLDPMVLRYYYLTHHYRSPLEFSWQTVEAVQKSYQRLVSLFYPVVSDEITLQEINNSPIAQQLLQALCDDLNTPALLATIFEHINELAQDTAQKNIVGAFLQQVLGLRLEPIKNAQTIITPHIQDLINQRETARANKDWKRADQLREELKRLGYEVHDKKSN